MAQVEPRTVPEHLCVEGRFAIGEACLEAEYSPVEITGCFDIGDKELRLGEGEVRFCDICCYAVSHGLRAFLQRLPAIEA
ncbi:hypothetical protein C8D77_107190 [Mesorhizobium loti]|uniref:Uncharacterized protein n=1 Tax=Rhizobium loti TaxID=381 RepID=A0A8E2WCX3_RHILI|nr:hypothetical protein C8D77_107190 [Mesorhizobium loti]